MGSAIRMAVTSFISLFVLSCLQTVYVEAFVTFLPNGDMDSIANYDLLKTQQQQPDSHEEKIFYKLLNNVLLNNLYKLGQRDMTNRNTLSVDQVPDLGTVPYFRSSKRIPQDLDKMMEKRKVFWQPMGYLPAGANPPANSGGHAGSRGGNGRTQVFRYG